MTKKKSRPASNADVAVELERLKSERAQIKEHVASLVAGVDRLCAWATKLETQIQDLGRGAYVEPPYRGLSPPKADNRRTLVGGSSDTRGSIPPFIPGTTVNPRRAPEDR